jgi:ketosteroid isomerase-like protein
MIAAVFSLIQLAWAQSPANGIDQLRAQWIQHWNARELDALMALYSADAVLLPPPGELIVGREKIKEHFKQLFDSAPSIHIQLTSDKTNSSGDLASDSGTYEETIGGGGVTISGNVAVSGNVTIGGGGQTRSGLSFLIASMFPLLHASRSALV